MRFSRQGYWSGLPFPSPGDLPNPGIDPGSPTLQADSLPTELQESLWQPKWNENRTVLVAAIHTPDRDEGPLDGAVAGSWSLGIVEQSQGEGLLTLEQ